MCTLPIWHVKEDVPFEMILSHLYEISRDKGHRYVLMVNQNLSLSIADHWVVTTHQALKHKSLALTTFLQSPLQRNVV